MISTINMTPHAEIQYPYRRDQVGIPFKDLLPIASSASSEGVIISPSGHELEYAISPGRVFIYDLDYKKFEMEGVNDGQIAEFNLHTRLNSETTIAGSNLTLHPDMFASEFIGFCLYYFATLGLEIRRCKGKWAPPNSDNFDMFMHEYAQHGDKIRAARATWSGRTFMKYRYTQLRDRDISITGLDDNIDPLIIAVFSRP